MPPEVSLAQHLRDRESSLPPKGFHNRVLNTIPELEINNSTIDTLPALDVLLRAFLPRSLHLNN